MTATGRSDKLVLGAGALVLALLAWQGHHLADRLPQFEQAISGLGAWGPVLFAASVLVLGPLLVPDTVFGLAAGACFGLVAGTAYYFPAVYVMCLGVQWLGRHALKARVLRLLEGHERLLAVARMAPEGGARFALLVRLLPVNQALLSYALGASGFPLRAAASGNFTMFTHLFPAVYIGAAAVDVTRMAGTGHQHWETEGAALVLGLALVVVLTLLVSRRALAALGAEADAVQ